MVKQKSLLSIYILLFFLCHTGCDIKQKNNTIGEQNQMTTNSLKEIDSENNNRNKQEILTDTESLEGINIGLQTWSKKNLDVTHFRNGDLIPEAKSIEEWNAAEVKKKPVWCYYNNDPENGKIYGKLYNWYAIDDARELSPAGWHIPNQTEWTTMTEYLERDEIGKILKATSGWPNNANGTNESGFTALPSGNRYKDGSFNDIGYGCSWWISTKNITSYPKPFFWGYQLTYNNNRLGAYSYRMNYGMSVRCISNQQIVAIGNDKNNYSQNELEETNETNNLTEVIIGTQTWSTKNLDVTHFRNGDIIKQAKSLEDWDKAGEENKPAWCYYDNDPDNGKKYGKLYNLFAVNDARGLAPEGWHVPSKEEWETLSDYLQIGEGRRDVSGYKMKSINGWVYKDTGGSNSSGFSGLPGGYRSFKYGKFTDIGTNAIWWTTTEEPGRGAMAESLCWCNSGLNSDWDYLNKENGLSVRCVKD